MAGRLGGPDAEETLAFRAIDKVLRTDPFLATKGVTFCSLQGDNGDMAEPSTAQMPYVSIAPAGDGTGWWSENQHKSDIITLIYIYVDGTHADDIINMWGWVRRGLFPTDPARLAIVKAIMGDLVVNGELNKQAYSGYAPDAKASCLKAEGAIKLRINVNT
jgi:hypothetical protein